MNTVINFEIAKLLKEKGFERNVGYSKPYYNHLGELNGDVTEYIRAQIHDEDTTPFETTPAPTIAEVVMWLHKEKGLWVNVMYMGFELKYSWSIDIITTSGSNWDSYGEEGDICYKSPTEAYEAAILYTLNNLI